MKKLLLICAAFIGLQLMAEERVVSIPNQEAFDSYWQLLDENVQADEAFQEWIPVGENREAWSKSFGIQRYQLKEDYDLKHFYKMFVETIAKDFEDTQESFCHEIQTQDENHLTFSWWCEGSDYEIGREWVHLLKEDSKRVLFVRFATKSSTVSDEDSVWRDCIADVAFTELDTLVN